MFCHLHVYYYICSINFKIHKDMAQNNHSQDSVQCSEKGMEQMPKRKKFQGFSMGFLLILLAAVVGLYIACTLLAS